MSQIERYDISNKVTRGYMNTVSHETTAYLDVDNRQRKIIANLIQQVDNGRVIGRGLQPLLLLQYLQLMSKYHIVRFYEADYLDIEERWAIT